MRIITECLSCKTNFQSYVSQNRKFCTKQCSDEIQNFNINKLKKYTL